MTWALCSLQKSIKSWFNLFNKVVFVLFSKDFVISPILKKGNIPGIILLMVTDISIYIYIFDLCIQLHFQYITFVSTYRHTTLITEK